MDFLFISAALPPSSFRHTAGSGSAGAIGKIKDEMIERLEPGITALKEQLTLNKAEWKKKGF
ncbi:MAG: hypothetical protein A2Y71_05335 [Bacteroidetes bacterium RBG_13_42_15]|nr:MAG: hypothetical protein A2Y71_05335 [Bacteroidetes bacterium RBG_13_42_15]